VSFNSTDPTPVLNNPTATEISQEAFTAYRYDIISLISFSPPSPFAIMDHNCGLKKYTASFNQLGISLFTLRYYPTEKEENI